MKTRSKTIKKLKKAPQTNADQLKNVCRGCLATERKMVSARPFKAVFKDLAGISIDPSDGLPQRLCNVCVALLQKCIQVRNKIKKSHEKLRQYARGDSVLLTYDKDAIPRLRRTIIRHHHYPAAQTKRVDSQLKKIPIVRLEMMPTITKIESLRDSQKKSTPDHNYNNKANDSVQTTLRVTSGLPKKIENTQNVKKVTFEKADSLEQMQPDLDDSNAILYQIIEEEEFKEEIVFPDYENYMTMEQWQQENPEFLNETYISADEISLSADETGISANEMKQEKQKEQTKYWTPVLRARTKKIVQQSATSTKDKKKPAFVKKVYHPANVPFGIFKKEKAELHRHNDSDSEDKNKSKTYICEKCKKVFTDQFLLMSHILQHTNDKPYKCEVCHKYFRHKYTYNKHCRGHVTYDKFQCDICKKFYRYKSYLAEHLRKHFVERQFKCHICDKVFKYKTNVNKHMRLHPGNDPYICDVCGRRYSSIEGFKRHCRLHVEKFVKCEICFKQFRFNSQLRRHQIYHTGIKQHKCDKCPRSFSERTQLNAHRRTHTGDKPYECEICRQKFVCNGSLLRHSVVHETNDNKCYLCFKTFSDRNYLRKHIRVHLPYKWFEIEQKKSALKKKLGIN